VLASGAVISMSALTGGVAPALAKPGHELQHRIATAEPTPEQIEVAEAALAACLELEKE